MPNTHAKRRPARLIGTISLSIPRMTLRGVMYKGVFYWSISSNVLNTSTPFPLLVVGNSRGDGTCSDG